MNPVAGASKEAGVGSNSLCHLLSRHYHILTTTDAHPRVRRRGPSALTISLCLRYCLWEGDADVCLLRGAGAPEGVGARESYPTLWHVMLVSQETTSCFDHRGCMPMAQAEELWSSPFSLCGSTSPSPLTCRTCRPAATGLIHITLTLHSILFRLFGVFLLNICFILRQHWNGVGLAAQSRGRTIHLVLILLGRTLPSPPAQALGPIFLCVSFAAYPDHFSEVRGPVNEQTEGPIHTVNGRLCLIPGSH